MGVENPTYYRVVGDTEISQLADKRTWNATDGVQTFKRFVGTADAIASKFNELSAGKDAEGNAIVTGVDDLDEDINGQSGRLLARVIEDSGGADGGNTEELNAVWELYASPLNKPIETHSDFDGVTVLRKRAIEKAARDAEALAGSATTAEKKLYAYYSNQVLDFMLTELELRKTTTLSSRSKIVASYTSMNRVVSLPSTPAALLGVLTSLPKMDGSSGTWEWLKLCPQLRQVAKRKFQLSYVWRGAERWAEIYGGSWTPTYG